MLNSIVDVLFPPRCYGCGVHLLASEKRERCCAACAHTVHTVESPRCVRCAMPRELRTGVDAVCSACLGRPPAFDSVEARWIYDGAVADAIRRAKTSDDPSSLFALVDSDRDWFRERGAQHASAHWTTPPVFAADLVRRGWDPARAAARRAVTVRFEDPLRKVRQSTKQAHLGRDARRAALHGAFESERQLSGDWVVFDDVMTTGATLHEVARILKLAGARRVDGLVLARAV